MRDFVVKAAIGSAGVAIASDILNSPLAAATSKASAQTMMSVPFEARERVRLGIIGVGGRGTSLLRDLLAVDGVDVKAICDLVPEKVEHAQKMVTDAGQPKPTGFTKGDTDFKNLTQLDLDGRRRRGQDVHGARRRIRRNFSCRRRIPTRPARHCDRQRR